jgi:L-lactate dehydrogenase complex protein LldG
VIALLADRQATVLATYALPGEQPRARYWVTGVSGTTDIEGQ